MAVSGWKSWIGERVYSLEWTRWYGSDGGVWWAKSCEALSAPRFGSGVVELGCPPHLTARQAYLRVDTWKVGACHHRTYLLLVVPSTARGIQSLVTSLLQGDTRRVIDSILLTTPVRSSSPPIYGGLAVADAVHNALVVHMDVEAVGEEISSDLGARRDDAVLLGQLLLAKGLGTV